MIQCLAREGFKASDLAQVLQFNIKYKSAWGEADRGVIKTDCSQGQSPCDEHLHRFLKLIIS